MKSPRMKIAAALIGFACLVAAGLFEYANRRDRADVTELISSTPWRWEEDEWLQNCIYNYKKTIVLRSGWLRTELSASEYRSAKSRAKFNWIQGARPLELTRLRQILGDVEVDLPFRMPEDAIVEYYYEEDRSETERRLYLFYRTSSRDKYVFDYYYYLVM